jgi:hypothetical protein
MPRAVSRRDGADRRVVALDTEIANQGRAAMLKQFTLTDGSPVTVNLTTVAYMTSEGDGTLLMFAGGVSIVIREPYDEVSDTKPKERIVGFGAG